jgi:hypothetical protein
MFKVGDRVRVIADCGIYYSKGDVGVVHTTYDTGEYKIDFDASPTVHDSPGTCGRVWWVCSPKYLELETKRAEPTSRANDPATSKGKRKANKYEQAVLTHLTMVTAYGGGATGKEIAKAADLPLNCITPRFAPLRRKGLIKPLVSDAPAIGVAGSIVKRDKQIVWVLA